MVNEKISLKILNKTYIQLLTYGCGKHKKGKIFTLSFQDFDLWYILTGSLNIMINGNHYCAVPGEAFLMTPGTSVTMQIKEYTELLYCHFSVELGVNKSMKVSFSDYKIPSNHTDILKVFVQNFKGLYNQNESKKNTITSILKVLLADMLMTNPDNPTAFLSNNDLSNFQSLSKVIKFINDNIEKSITCKTLAYIAGFNESYFSRYFKNHMGISPKQYILRAKMNYATHLLVDKHLSVKETAFRVGFSDPFTFSKQFKNFYSISPSNIKDVNKT